MAARFIETKADDLLSLVREKKKLPVQRASEALGVPFSMVEEWGKSMESAGLVEIEYSMGGMVLVSKSEEEAKDLPVKKEIVPTESDPTSKPKKKKTFLEKTSKSPTMDTKKMLKQKRKELSKELDRVVGDLIEGMETEAELENIKSVEKDIKKTAKKLKRGRKSLL